MENLKLHIEERLWNSVKRNYTTDNYSNAILDAIQFVGDVIREKSGLESDGVQLIGAALGGENPKIKLNNLSTDSEKNIQKGIESIFRGLYSAYRNPRSHSKIEDSEIDAFEVITFINHLLKIVDKSTGKFSSELFFKRIFDDDFVRTKKYADLIIKDIPKPRYFEVALGMYRAKESGNIYNLKLVWDSIIGKLSEKQKMELCELAAEELRYTDSISVIIRCISLFRELWTNIEEDARIRAENKLIKVLPESEKYVSGGLNTIGAQCSWLTTIIKVSVSHDLIFDKLNEMLENGSESNQRYAIDYFGRYFDILEDGLINSFTPALLKGLKEGNTIIHSFVTSHYKGTDKKALAPALKQFVPKVDLDDLPF